MKKFAVYLNNLSENIIKILTEKERKFDLFSYNKMIDRNNLISLKDYDLTVSPDFKFYEIFNDQCDISVFNLPEEIKFYLNRVKGDKIAILSNKKWVEGIKNIHIYNPEEIKKLLQDFRSKKINYENFKNTILEVLEKVKENNQKKIFIALDGEEIIFKNRITPLSIFYNYSLNRLSYPGILIVIEGIDGSGKSTQADNLYVSLQDRFGEVVKFREPTSSEWGREIREKAKTKEGLTPIEQYKLFLKDRSYNFSNNLFPFLEKGYIVIVDRYYHSTYSYQGAVGIDKHKILKENLRICSPPELLFVLDLKVEDALKRISFRKKDELFESEKLLKKVRKNYMDFTGRGVNFINANMSKEEIEKSILEKIDNYIKTCI